MNELKVSDVKAIGGKRYDSEYFTRHKNIFFLLIMSFAILVVGMICMICDSNERDIQPSIYTNVDDNEISVTSSDEYINVNNVIYLKEKENENSNPWSPFYIMSVVFGMVGLISLVVISVYYAYKLDNFRDRFVQHWVDTKEFLEAD